MCRFKDKCAWPDSPGAFPRPEDPWRSPGTDAVCNHLANLPNSIICIELDRPWHNTRSCVMKTAFFGKWRRLTVPILAALLGASTPSQAAAPATTWAAPPGEKLCEDYELRVNGQPVPVYACRVSAVPFNQVWPGYQRPIDQTELAGFAHWGMSGPVSVEVTAKQSFTNVVVRPGARGVRPAVNGRTITFALSKAGQVTVELDGPHHALHLFADPPETGAPNRDAAGVRYFAPGVYQPGKIQLKSGETLYLAGGAVVYTAVEARGAAGVRILGRGIIDTQRVRAGSGRRLYPADGLLRREGRGRHPPRPGRLVPERLRVPQRRDRQRQARRPVALQRRRHRHLQQPGRPHPQLLRSLLRRRHRAQRAQLGPGRVP